VAGYEERRAETLAISRRSCREVFLGEREAVSEPAARPGVDRCRRVKRVLQRRDPPHREVIRAAGQETSIAATAGKHQATVDRVRGAPRQARERVHGCAKIGKPQSTAVDRVGDRPDATRDPLYEARGSSRLPVYANEVRSTHPRYDPSFDVASDCSWFSNW
jgi:hypothetical protein